MTEVQPVQPADASAWLQMRRALWPDGSEAEHRTEIDLFLEGRFPRRPWGVLMAKSADGRALGFVELSVRPYAEGCRSARVAYLEGWFVIPEARRQGVGRALIRAAEAWGREQGAGEFASDADPDNEESPRAHLALGFDDAGLVRCFGKKL